MFSLDSFFFLNLRALRRARASFVSVDVCSCLHNCHSVMHNGFTQYVREQPPPFVLIVIFFSPFFSAVLLYSGRQQASLKFAGPAGGRCYLTRGLKKKLKKTSVDSSRWEGGHDGLLCIARASLLAKIAFRGL